MWLDGIRIIKEVTEVMVEQRVEELCRKLCVTVSLVVFTMNEMGSC